MNKKIKCFVIASILLNLLLVGVLIGHFSHGFGHRPPPPPEAPEIALLPEAKQKLFRQTMAEARSRAEDIREESRDARDEAADILAAPTFDKVAYFAKIKEMTALYEQRKLYFAEAVTRIAEQFTPEERKVLAKILRRPPPPPPHLAPRPGDGPPPPPPAE